jgi:drug/metabolite transporter (DMT)-like permease
MAYGVVLALAAALAFGVTAPLVQHFGRDVGPFWTAALLYAGAAAVSLPRGKKGREARLLRSDAPRLALVALFGAFVAPAALAWGLARTSGTSAALMLNLEAGLTVILGKLLFDEHIGRRVGVAAALIAVGGAVLIMDRQGAGGGASLGLVAVGVATVGWSLDNALSRPLADRDPGAVVFVKGSLGALLSLAVALAAHDAPPGARAVGAIGLCGAVGFGLSLRMYLLAQRRMGAARTASVFAVAPFVGALVAAAMGEGASLALGLAATAMAIGVYLHVTEKHAHWHEHGPTFHDHAHRHDDGHHNHHHDPMPEGEHAHPHTHEPLAHAHDHGEDLHHRHH